MKYKIQHENWKYLCLPAIIAFLVVVVLGAIFFDDFIDNADSYELVYVYLGLGAILFTLFTCVVVVLIYSAGLRIVIDGDRLIIKGIVSRRKIPIKDIYAVDIEPYSRKTYSRSAGPQRTVYRMRMTIGYGTGTTIKLNDNATVRNVSFALERKPDEEVPLYQLYRQLDKLLT
ncbi:MAG: PH domain-containing protein [Lachnospiraceae bacterium]|nr:PH domain-containing protein [Lachnospiraceae bacterium]